MGAYSYCQECDAGLDAPTIRESLCKEAVCGSCGYNRDISDWEIAEALISVVEQMIERIKQLEEKSNDPSDINSRYLVNRRWPYSDDGSGDSGEADPDPYRGL